MAETILLNPNEIKINTRFRKDVGSLDELRESIREVGLLQPVGVDKEKTLVFGERRLLCWKELWPEKPIPCVVITGDLYKLKVAELHENVKRQNMEWPDVVRAEEEIRQTYEKLYGWKEHGGDRKSTEFKKESEKSILSGGIDSQTKLGKDLDVSQQKLSQDLRLARGLKAHPEIEKEPSKRKALRKLKQIEAVETAKPKPTIPKFLYEPEISNLWQFDRCDDRFGFKDYPGRMPGQVVINLLHFFTEPNDIVVDPFAGSGTTIDVCKAMTRQIKAFDIRPTLPEIIKNDAVKGIPITDNTANFVLLDPPYANMKKGEYTNDSSDLSNLGLKEYHDAMTTVISEAFRILKKDGKMALITSSIRSSGEVTDLAFDCYKIAEKIGFHSIERIIVPYAGNEASFNGSWITQAKEGKFMLRKYRDLMVFRK